MAKLYFSYAAMNAGKSAILLQAAHNYRERGMNPLLLTSALYREADGHGQVTSRIGMQAPALLYKNNENLLALIHNTNREVEIDVVFVDEAQFLTREQVWELARVADRLNIPVLAYGLRTDFRGELFDGSAALLAIADSIREIRTICHCGRKATMVARLDSDGNVLTDGAQIAVEKAQYLSLCRRHWEDQLDRV